MKRLVLVFLVAVCISSFGLSCSEEITSVDSQIMKAVAPVAKGQGVSQAAAYDKDSDFPCLVITGLSGKAHKWTDSLPEWWLPSSLEEVQLVVCVGREKKEEIETCRYKDNAPPVKRYKYSRNVVLREAKTGAVVASTTIKGLGPGPCRWREDWNLTELKGSRVTFDQLKEWLEPYVV